MITYNDTALQSVSEESTIDRFDEWQNIGRGLSHLPNSALRIISAETDVPGATFRCYLSSPHMSDSMWRITLKPSQEN